MNIILGLGNPGQEYAGHRHNIGFWCADQVARRMGVRMRRSGQAMAAVGQLALHGRAPEDLVVLHDDVELPLGKLRVKEGGGHGGHNGLRSIIEVTGSRDFLRIRLGVGRPEDRREDLADWVLSDFGLGERPVARELAERGADAVEAVLTAGIKEAMNLYHVPAGAGRARND
jgi:PTH1 family peptidyl-tRNA hydrolase